MRLSLKQTALAFLLSLPALVFAAGLEQFRSFVASTKSARGEFTQRQVKMIDGNARLSNAATGTFVFARPGRFVWTYLKPYQQVLQADGENLYVYDKDLNQVTVRKLGNALSASPAAILLGSGDVEKSFALKDAGTKDGLAWVEAIPRAKDTSFEKIGIGMRNGVPEAMEMRDAFGQITLLSFKKFERNPALNSGQFRFVAPKGVDVLRQ